jgi:O-antigen ligase
MRHDWRHSRLGGARPASAASQVIADQRATAAYLICLAGCAVGVFLSGSQESAALIAVTAAAGLAVLFANPSRRPPWFPILCSLIWLVAAASALLPAASASLPEWRNAIPPGMVLGSSLAAMPAHTGFWIIAAASTMAAAFIFLASPPEVRGLAVFLHATALIIAVYATISIAQSQGGLLFPFSGDANFGLLPNRNHTATLLVVGSVVSFGLMQWELARGFRTGAILAALWGAPSLAALLFFSSSRAGVVFLVVGFVFWAAGATGKVVRRKTALATAAILAAFLFVLFIFGGSAVRDRLAELWSDVVETEAGRGEFRDVDFRQPIFRDTWQMIADAPLTGQGMGHFEFVFPHYRRSSANSSRVLHPESDWLMVAAESGGIAVALVGAASWYLVRCWRGRARSGGLLRWTAASAIGAALLHGLLDVPWHRPALGWFLLIVALASAPPSDSRLQRPLLWRAVQVSLGLVLLAAAIQLGLSAARHHPPLVYRWEAYSAELRALLEARRFDDGEFVARAAISDFPLKYQAYYWRAAFLRMFQGTDDEIAEAMAAGLFAEPVLPIVAAEQARIWQGVNNTAEAQARTEAIRRSLRIDRLTGESNLAQAQLESTLRESRQRPAVQSSVRQGVASEPALLAQWLRHANPELVETFLAGLGAGAFGFLDNFPPDLRGEVLERWITLPSAPAAVAYMESRESPGPYWRQLAKHYAKVGDKPRAVGIVAQAEGLKLDGTIPSGEFARQLDQLRTQGNDVAVRRLVKEAAEDKEPDAEKLRVSLVIYGAAGDWEMAWRAASRLVTAREKGQ